MYNLSTATPVLAAWDIGTFLKNSKTTLEVWGGNFIKLVGAIMIIIAVYKIAKGLISHGKGPNEYTIAIILFLVGGALLGGGFMFVKNISSGGQKTINDLGDGTGSTILSGALPSLYTFLPFLPFL